MALALVVGTLVALTVALIAWQVERRGADRLVASHLRTRYLVTLKSGESFDGLLEDADSMTLVMVSAKSLAVGRDPIAVDGSLILSRSDVAYLQRP